MTSPDQIKDDIDQTREELRADVQALQDKVDPVQQFDSAIDTVQDMTREHPWRMAASAFVAGWMGAWVVSTVLL
jgi:ElaB/YqjD/DUF883 family membrane-anchored ribosome-binding protein